jgi:hypothetical protein
MRDDGLDMRRPAASSSLRAPGGRHLIVRVLARAEQASSDMAERAWAAAEPYRWPRQRERYVMTVERQVEHPRPLGSRAR